MQGKIGVHTLSDRASKASGRPRAEQPNKPSAWKRRTGQPIQSHESDGGAEAN